jgi:hypothetical protein
MSPIEQGMPLNSSKKIRERLEDQSDKRKRGAVGRMDGPVRWLNTAGNRHPV